MSLGNVQRLAAADNFAREHGEDLMDVDEDAEPRPPPAAPAAAAVAAAAVPPPPAAASPTVARAAPPVMAQRSQRSARLSATKAKWTAEGMLKNSKSESAFDSHQRENEMLIYHLFRNDPSMLHDSYCHHLHDVEATITYEHITHPRNRYRGKKTEAERKAEWDQTVLRKEISGALGPGGTRRPEPTVNFTAFTADPVTYAKYIQRKVKKGDVLMKPGVYAGYVSSLRYLFKRYHFRPSLDYEDELKDYMEGVKRIANEACQNGEVSAACAIRPLQMYAHMFLLFRET